MSKSRPASVMDAPASPWEIQQEQERMWENHNENALFEAENAGRSKNVGMPYDPLFGTSPADAKAKRQANGMFAPGDDEPPPADWIDSYTGPTNGSQVHDVDQLRDYVAFQMQLAREKHPDDFDEIIHEHVIPMMREMGMDENELKLPTSTH